MKFLKGWRVPIALVSWYNSDNLPAFGMMVDIEDVYIPF